MTSVSRRDIVWVDFDEDPPEPEFNGSHPAIVVQNDSENRTLDSTIVVPITTSQHGREELLTDVRIPSSTEDVDEDSTAKLDLMTVVSVPRRILNEGDREEIWKMGEISPSTMTKIENYLEVLLGM